MLYRGHAAWISGDWKLHRIADKNGTFVVSPDYDYITLFVDGIATVEKSGKWGVLDVSGNWVAGLQFEDCGLFSQPIFQRLNLVFDGV